MSQINRQTEKYEADELREKLAIQHRIISIITHDIKGSMHFVSRIASLLAFKSDYKMDSECRTTLEEVARTSQSLHDLLNNMLYWSGLQTSRFTPEKKVFSIKGVLIDSLKVLNDQANRKQVNIVDYLTEEDVCLADRHMISVAMLNTLSNAIKYSKKGGIIEVSALSNNGQLIITIEDDGIGIPEDMLLRIKMNQSTSPQEGTNGEFGSGLGVCIVSEMIALNQGELTIDSEVGKGTRVTFKLPS